MRLQSLSQFLKNIGHRKIVKNEILYGINPVYEALVAARRHFFTIYIERKNVSRRLKKLIDMGIIKYFYTMIDASKLGYLSCRLFITFQRDNPVKEKEIVVFFMARPDTWWVPSMEGQRNLAIAIWAKDTYDFYDIINEFRKKYKPFIKDIIPGIYARLHQFRRIYLLKVMARLTFLI